MSSLMTSPNSSAPESEWSVNHVKKLSGSSCCLFLPALLCVWLDRLVRSCKRRKDSHYKLRCVQPFDRIQSQSKEPFNNKHHAYFSWFPFDLCWLWGWVSTFIQVNFFGEDFVLKIHVFIEILKGKGKESVSYGNIKALSYENQFLPLTKSIL